MDLFTSNIMAELGLDVTEIFNADAKAQGLYIPPMMIQAIDRNGQITTTRTLSDDGNIMRTSVGRPLEVPGAPAAFSAAQAMQARDLGLARPAKDGDGSGGAGSGGNPGTCEKNDDHGSKATVREQPTYKEGNAEAETKQRELKRAKRAKRNAMERDRKKRKQVQAKQGTQRNIEEAVVIADQGDESEKNAGHGASNGAGVGLAQAHSKMRSKQNGSGFPVSACKPLIV